MKAFSKAQRRLYSLLRKFGHDESGAADLVFSMASGTPNATLSISLIDGNTDVVAPYAAVLRAGSFSGFNVTEPAGDTNVYDETQHKITFIWDFGDAAYVPRQSLNLPTGWHDLNVAYGKQVAHVWRTPGSYTVTCFAFDTAGNWGTATFNRTIGSANDLAAYAGAGTIVWSTSSNFVGAPAGSTQCATIAEVHTALRARLAASQFTNRILLRAGDTFTNNFFFDIGETSTGYPGGTSFNYRGARGVLWSRFGTGANPVAEFTGSVKGRKFSSHGTDNATARQWVIDSIDFLGTWDATKETGYAVDNYGLFRWGTVLFTRCRFSGIYIPPLQNDQYGRFVIAHDCEFTNWQEYGLYNNTTNRQAYLGNKIAQPVAALTGSGVPNGNGLNWGIGNNHAFRTEQVYDTIMSCNEVYVPNGWSGGLGDRITSPPTAAQPSLRWWNYFTSDPNLRRHHHVMERNSFEPGLALGPVQFGGTRVETAPKNLLFERNIVAGYSWALGGFDGAMLTTSLCGVTIRNNFFWRPNVASVFPSSLHDRVIATQFLSDGTLAGIGPVEIYNNTILDETPSGKINASTYVPFLLASGVPAGYHVIENNVVRCINAPVTADRGAAFLPLSTTAIAGYSPKFPGPRWNFRYIYIADITAVREGGAGTVANNEWIRVAWPSITGENNGAAPVGVAGFRSAVIANSTQRHTFKFVNVAPMTDTAIYPDSMGGVTFDFTDPTFCRVRNVTGSSWVSGQAVILFDLSDILMSVMSSFASPSTVPQLVPEPTSGAYRSATTGLTAHFDSTGATHQGKRLSSGGFEPGTTPSQGWRKA